MSKTSWLNNAIVKGLDPHAGLSIEQVLNPAARLGWMTEDQRESLIDFMRQVSEITYRDEEEDKKFDLALLQAARKATCEALDDPDTAPENWEGSEFAQLVHYALNHDEHDHPRGYRGGYNVELADKLGVEVPERIRKIHELHQRPMKNLLEHKIDAIIKHFNIEVPEITEDED